MTRVAVVERRVERMIGEAPAHRDRLAGGDRRVVVRGGLRALLRGVDPVGPAMHDGLADAVLDVGSGIGDAKEALGVGVVLGEQERGPVRKAVEIPPASAEVGVLGAHGRPRHDAQRGPCRGVAPRPGVAVPQVRQHVQRGRRRAPVDGRDPAQEVLRSGLGILDEHIEVAALLEGLAQRVDQLELARGARPPPVLLDQEGVGVRDLRVLVEHPHVGVGRRAIEVEVVLLDILAVIALRTRQAEASLLEDGVTPIPERDRQAQVLEAVAKARQAVLVPAVGTAAGVVVREESSTRRPRRCSPRGRCPRRAR